MKTVIDAIKQARKIHTECNKRATILRNIAKQVNNSKNINTWIKQLNKINEMLLDADLLEKRGNKVWFAVTSYQGKYINCKDIHEINGVRYVGIMQLLNASID